MSMLVALGEPLAVFSAGRVGAARVGDTFRLGLGGAECNVAVGVRRLGHRSAVIGRTGEDPLGQAVTGSLRADGVETSVLRIDPDGATGIMFKELRAAGRIRISYARKDSAGSRLSSADLDRDLLRGAAVLHTTGVTASFGQAAQEAIEQAAAIVHSAGGLVSFDVNYRRRLWPDVATGGEILRRLVGHSDILFLTLDEAKMLLPAKGNPSWEVDRVVNQISELGPNHIVLKTGPSTVHALIHGEPLSIETTPVPVVDPVGAGDAFAAGYLSELMLGRPNPVRLQTAMTMGRWAVSTEGDNEGLPTSDEIDLLTADNVIR
jgi:2-dehydro-3-deoxygluconokinase